MLGKLLKHEWKETYRFGCLMLLLLAGFTLMGCLAFQMPLFKELFAEAEVADQGGVGRILMNVVGVLVLVLYVFAVIGIGYGMMLYLGIHFYQTMFTDRGYLTHTLPVKANRIFLAKVLNSGVWELIILVASLLSVIILCMTAVFTVFTPVIVDYADVLGALGEIGDDVSKLLGTNISTYYLVTFIFSILTPFMTIILMFGACCVGQLLSKVKVFMSVVCFMGIQMILKMIQNISNMVLGIYAAESEGVLAGAQYYMWTGLWVNIMTYVALAIAFYFISCFLIKRKLNLD